jgi:hypothetical protein
MAGSAINEEGNVDVRIQVVIEYENARHVETIAVFRRDELQPETLGLTRAESQDLLAISGRFATGG